MFSGFKYIDCGSPCSIESLIEPSDSYQLQDKYSLLLDLVHVLKKSPTASFLLTEAASYDFDVLCDSHMNLDTAGFHNAETTIILPEFDIQSLKYKKNYGRALITIIAGLRRALKSNQGHYHRFDLEPLEYLRLVRLVEADIDSVVTQACWELRTADEPAPWRQLLSGKKGDLAVIYTNAMEKTPMGQFNGQLMRYVFRQWFADIERVNAADHTALEFLDMGIAHPEFFEMNADTKLVKNDMRKLQKNLPFAKYLDGINVFGKWFDGLKDPFNQAHLHHILQDLSYIADNHTK